MYLPSPSLFRLGLLVSKDVLLFLPLLLVVAGILTEPRFPRLAATAFLLYCFVPVYSLAILTWKGIVKNSLSRANARRYKICMGIYLAPWILGIIAIILEAIAHK